jgi:hypothetical protein
MEKQTEKRIVTFEIFDRMVQGYYEDVKNGVVTVTITHDSASIFREGSQIGINKRFLADYMDMNFIYDKEFEKFNFVQKIFGKHYLGIPVLGIIVYFIYECCA